MAQLGSLIRTLARRAGCDIRRYRPLVSDPYVVQRELLRTIPCSLIFDIGAFHGEAAAQYGQMFPAADIYAFEPFPPSYGALAARFAGEKRIHVVNAAVSSQTGEATFHVNGLPETNSLLPRPTTGHQYFPTAAATEKKISVPTTTVDEFCEKNKLGVPQILKMDIQGNELAALKGAEKALASGQISLIFSEVTFVPHYEGGVLFHELSAFLAGRGFTLLNLYEMHSASGVGQLRFGDAIYLSDKLRRDVIDRE
ncbi:MAG TPA: FkbM family methyltransferase [Lacipirellulaceae bacterium]|jgi:FkbM family methyltransferase|nr:FkbM family methyltransferase [Lacipirellulaceae bacterium]